MKFKKATIATSLYLSCHLALAATYTPTDNSGFNSINFSYSNNQTDTEKEYRSAINLVKHHKLKAAKEKVNTLIKSNPKETNFYNLLALIQTLENNNKEAIQTYLKALEIKPKSLKTNLGLSSTYLTMGELDKATQYANTSLSIKSESLHANILLAEIAFKEKDLQEAEKQLLKAQQKAQGKPDQEINIANRLAKLYFVQKQAPKALAIAEKTAKQYPSNNTALALLAQAQLLNQKIDAAIPNLEKLIKQAPQDTKHRLILAKLFTKKEGKKQQVIKLLDEIETIAPKNPQLIAQKSTVLTQLKMYPEAIQDAKKVQQLAPKSGIGEVLEAEAYRAEKKLDLALTLYKESYKIRANPKVMQAITQVMFSQGNVEGAQKFILQALQKDPKNSAARFILAQTYQQQNNIAEAEKHYKIILETNPDNLLALNNLAWIYHEQNNPKGLGLIEKAYKKAPKSASITDTYATILVAKGETTKGIALFEKAVELAPKNGEIQFHLAQAYVSNGQTQQAIQVLNTIINFKQDFPQKQEAIKLLSTLK